jgi:nucleoid-associated protein YgaU
MAALYEGRHLNTATLSESAPRFTDNSKPRRYTVEPGDTLVDIAQRFGLEGGWKALYEKNLWILGGNPNDLLPGQRLAL